MELLSVSTIKIWFQKDWLSFLRISWKIRKYWFDYQYKNVDKIWNMQIKLGPVKTTLILEVVE